MGVLYGGARVTKVPRRHPLRLCRAAQGKLLAAVGPHPAVKPLVARNQSIFNRTKTDENERRGRSPRPTPETRERVSVAVKTR
eukprot:8267961-Pyramimonas_sp.AAC.1